MNIGPNSTIITKTGVVLHVGAGIAKGSKGIFFETVLTLGLVPELLEFQDGDKPIYKDVPLEILFEYINVTCGGGIPFSLLFHLERNS